MEILLKVRNLLIKAGNTTILDLPELDVFRNEVLVLLGPNGAGKSTLLKVAAGLMRPAAGIVQFFGNPNLSDLDYRRKVSTVFQSPLLLTDTVRNNIASGLNFRGIPKKEIIKRVDRWMDILHISHLENRQAKVLSGGEAQRVSLARAFCLETELILMDEPFSALDTPTRLELLDDLRNILAKTNQTCIYVTHDLEEGLTIGDRVAVMFGGKLHQISSVQNAFDHPSTPEVAAFMGVENIISGIVEKSEQGMVSIKVGTLSIDAVGDYSTGSSVFVCLRPEDITLYSAEQEMKSSTARNRLLCRITNISNQGSLIRVDLDLGFKLISLITRPSAQEMGLVAGKQVVAVFKATAIHLLPTKKPYI